MEDREQLRVRHELGFHLFQGYLLARPEAVEGRALSPRRLTCLRVLDKLCDQATSAGDIEQIVRTDASLSYRFLKAAGAGAASGLFRSLRSVRDAVLGERRLRSWVMLMLLADAHDGCDEQLTIALTGPLTRALEDDIFGRRFLSRVAVACGGVFVPGSCRAPAANRSGARRVDRGRA